MSSVICDSDAATAAAAAADGSTHLTDSFCCYTHTYTHTQLIGQLNAAYLTATLHLMQQKTSVSVVLLF